MGNTGESTDCSIVDRSRLNERRDTVDSSDAPGNEVGVFKDNRRKLVVRSLSETELDQTREVVIG